VPDAATILVIDDEEAVRETFARLLRPKGYEVRTAEGAEAGLIEAELVQPDVVIVDLRMPFVDGIGFLRRFREREPRKHTPVAVVTGDYELEDATIFEVLNLGAKLMFKPLWLDDLLGLIHTSIPAAR
jgi:DNA-binding response OmpR family regulator